MPLSFVYNGRRYPQSIGPADTLNDVFRRFSEEMNFNVRDYTLHHRGKEVPDMQNPLRFNTVLNSATIDVVAKNSSSMTSTGGMVKVALQLPGGRKITEVETERSLIEMLMDLQSSGDIAESADVGQAVVIHMRRQIQGDELFEPLSSFGIQPGKSTMFRINLPAGTENDVDTVMKSSPAVTTPPASLAEIPRRTTSQAGPATAASSQQTSKHTSKQDETQTKGTDIKPSNTKLSESDMDKIIHGETNAFLFDLNSSSVQDGIQMIRRQCFDSDAISVFTTLVRILDNVVKKPGNDKVRRLRLSNTTIAEQIAKVGGAVLCLRHAGFFATGEDIATACTDTATEPVWLVLDRQQEEVQKIVQVRQVLAQTLSKLGERTPSTPSVDAYNTAKQTEQQAAVEFDPYQSNIVKFNSNAPGASNNNGDQFISDSERELHRLKQAIAAEQAKFRFNAANPPPRQTRYFSPEECAAGVPTMATISTTSSSAATNETDTTSKRNPSDTELIFAAQRRRRQEISATETFRTPVMRELEKLKREKIYETTIIRVLFPDRSFIQGVFAPDEKIQTVLEWVIDCLTAETRDNAKIELFLTPPRRALDCKQTLQNAELYPASSVFVSLRSTSADSNDWLNDSTRTIKEEIRTNQSTQLPQFPVPIEITSQNSTGASSSSYAGMSRTQDKRQFSSNSDVKRSSGNQLGSGAQPKWLNRIRKNM